MIVDARESPGHNPGNLLGAGLLVAIDGLRLLEFACGGIEVRKIAHITNGNVIRLHRAGVVGGRPARDTVARRGGAVWAVGRATRGIPIVYRARHDDGI